MSGADGQATCSLSSSGTPFAETQNFKKKSTYDPFPPSGYGAVLAPSVAPPNNPSWDPIALSLKLDTSSGNTVLAGITWLRATDGDFGGFYVYRPNGYSVTFDTAYTAADTDGVCVQAL